MIKCDIDGYMAEKKGYEKLVCAKVNAILLSVG